MTRAVASALAAVAVLATGCGGGSGSSGGMRVAPPPTLTPSPMPTASQSPAKYLKHVVIVIQENRTIDNLFNGFCLANGDCADTVTADPVTHTTLVPESLAAPYSPYHGHDQFVLQYDYGKMDGFKNTDLLCENGREPCPFTAFAYVPRVQTERYRKMATVDGVLSDRTFETSQGPSYPAHLYAIAGQSGGYDSDHLALISGTGDCDSTEDQASQILMTSPFPGKHGPNTEPCKDFPTIFDAVAKAGHTWRYYSYPDLASEIRSPTQSIHHLYNSPYFVTPSTRFFDDVAHRRLADVAYIISPHGADDHPLGVTDPQAGPRWVSSIVDAIGESPYWNDTAVVIWWDDWGGWFDHVVPPVSPVRPDPFEYGFRVPLIVVSAYARVGTVDHTTRTFVSALRLIEETFGLPSLGTTDQYEPDGLDSMFDFARRPIRFTPIGD
jgi:phospholipase C